MRWIWFLLVALVPSHAAGQSARIDEVVVLERGVYRAETAGPSQHHGTAGRLHTVQRIKLLADTTSIPARRFTRFGLRYLVKGAPHGTLVELRMVTRFPRDGVVEPPGDRRHFEHEYRLPVRIGISGYREYYLDESWEVAFGEWVLEFWLGSLKLQEQSFCLFDPDAPAPSSGCTIVVGSME